MESQTIVQVHYLVSLPDETPLSAEVKQLVWVNVDESSKRDTILSHTSILGKLENLSSNHIHPFLNSFHKYTDIYNYIGMLVLKGVMVFEMGLNPYLWVYKSIS